MSGCSEVSKRDDGADGQRASADTRRRKEPLERRGEQSGLVRSDQANDMIAGDTPRAVSNHFRSSFPDPALAGTAKKDAFRRCVTTMGQRHVRGRLLAYLQLMYAVTRRFFPVGKIFRRLVVD